ncbi:MAG: hypothetical protein AB3N64_08875 [Puniceicoccaceae bacterium]
MKPLSERIHKYSIEAQVLGLNERRTPLNDKVKEDLDQLVGSIQAAHAASRPVICAIGAHTIRNGLGPVLARLMERGWINHLATNGAGIIHDWEFSFLGSTCEDVEYYTSRGEFGNWEETGRYLNLALLVGAYEGLGYGESIGRMIEEEGLTIPSGDALIAEVEETIQSDSEKAAAAADLLWAVRKFELEPGRISIPHPWKQYSAQAAAYRSGTPFTGHPMIGHDIIYNHPMNHCAALGRCAERDFLAFANNVSRIDGGVYLSVGSAVMSPMVFEKSLSMARNLVRQRGEDISNHSIFVADLAESSWDWSKGEPPSDNPAYFLRYNKTFSRMGGAMRYLQIDNRDLLLNLAQSLLDES